MRIITGSARGTKLLTLSGESTRPTAERTKEAVFSMIQFDIEGRRVLDLFGGSGQLSLEALSRGASDAVICDSSKEAAEIIRKNAERTRMSDRVKLFNCDFLKLIPGLAGTQFDLVFLDPPYALGLIPTALVSMLSNKVLKSTTIIVCESAKGEDVFRGNDMLKNSFDIKKQAKYGAAYVTLLQPKEEVI
jgi:16S rRNA (guanine(966)-N(2))-methyltransferase RsmD